jgi:membrane-bound lytic murein transglycosylase B
MHLKKFFTAPLIAIGILATGIGSSSFADYSTHPEAAEFIDLMVEKHQFERDEIVGWLKVAKHQTSIVSIIGVETNYGSNTGSYKVVDALATLAFDYYTYTEKRASRKRFFTAELENLFLLAREQNQNPVELKGSYAGAMGLGQFMPSSYRNYAVDFDNDQFANIWTNPTDAIGSVANYFARHGWRQGEAVAMRANINTDPAEDSLNKLHRPKATLAELNNQGYKTIEQFPADTKVLPMRFQAKYGNEYWLGLHNFYVISRYNPRTKYAMAVYQLSELIRERNCAQTSNC